MITDKVVSNKNKSWIMTVEPTTYPVTVAQIKDFARIDGNSEDTILESFLIGVVNDVESYLGRSLITRTYKIIMDRWDNKELELPMPPLQSVISVNTIDEDDTETEYDSDYYYVITESIPGKIIIKQSSTEPQNTVRSYGGFNVYFTAGYGDADDIPKQIKVAIMQWVTMIYENRIMTTNEMLKNEPPPEVKKILKTYRVINT